MEKKRGIRSSQYRKERDMSAYDQIEEYDIPEEAKEGLKEIFDNIIESTGLDREKLSAINMGSRSTPNICLLAGQSEAGTIAVDLEGNIDYKPDRDMEALAELVAMDKTIEKNIKKFDEKVVEMAQEEDISEPSIQEVMDLFEGNETEPTLDIGIMEPEAIKEDKVPDIEIPSDHAPDKKLSEQMREDFAEINKLQRENKVYVPTWQEMQQRRMLREQETAERKEDIQNKRESIGAKYAAKEEARKEARQERKDNSLLELRRELKKDAKAAHEELQQLNRELKAELNKAEAFNPKDPYRPAMSSETVKKIEAIQNNITKTTNRYYNDRAALPTLGEVIRDSFKNIKESIKESIESSLDKIKHAYEVGILAGTKSLGDIKDTVKLANERADAHIETAYMNVEERVNQIGRNYMHVSHAIDKAVEKEYSKIHERLEKQYEKTSQIKNAFKNIGRAFRGEPQVLDSGFTQKQIETLAKIEKKIDNYHNSAEKTADRYRESFHRSVENMRGMQGLRKDLNMEKDFDLDEAIRNAYKHCAKAKMERQAEPQKEAAKSKSSPELNRDAR